MESEHVGCNLRPMARLYPTLILPFVRGGNLPNGILDKARGINSHGKPGSTKIPEEERMGLDIDKAESDLGIYSRRVNLRSLIPESVGSRLFILYFYSKRRSCQ